MTPKIEDKEVQRLLKKLNATHEPDYLDVTPEPTSEAKDCFIVVQDKVKKEE